MIVEIKPGEEFFPKYDGFYLTNSAQQVIRWQDDKEIPSKEYRLSTQRCGSTTLKNTGNNSFWLWRKGPEFRENEFGVECP